MAEVWRDGKIGKRVRPLIKGVCYRIYVSCTDSVYYNDPKFSWWGRDTFRIGASLPAREYIFSLSLFPRSCCLMSLRRRAKTGKSVLKYTVYWKLLPMPLQRTDNHLAFDVLQFASINFSPTFFCNLIKGWRIATWIVT